LSVIGDNLRRIRKEKRGMGQIELAEASDVAQPTISEIETGRREPHHSTLRKLADALGVEVVEFFAEEPQPEGPPPRPRTPLTDEPEEMFEKRLRKVDTESKARALRNALDAEVDELRRWRTALERRDADTAQARSLLKTAGKRWRAAALLWADFVALGDEERERAIRRRSVEEAGEAG
jgi:transcriptional regulator with XRE-family HTH domain